MIVKVQTDDEAIAMKIADMIREYASRELLLHVESKTQKKLNSSSDLKISSIAIAIRHKTEKEKKAIELGRRLEQQIEGMH